MRRVLLMVVVLEVLMLMTREKQGVGSMWVLGDSGER